MKFSSIILLFLITLAFTSCKKDVEYEYEREYKQSLNAWREFKTSSGNSYEYTVTTSSWVGISTETTVTVRNGQIVSRSYIRRGNNWSTNPPVVTVLDQWTEDQNSVNSHNEGFKAVTMDEIYERAKNEWLKERLDTKTYFETNNNGMISLCGYVPNGCADDCFTGITITSIKRI